MLAIILWVYVSNEQNPAGERLLNISLEHTEPAKNLLITEGMPEVVKVRVVGNKNQLANLTPGDFKAVVDLAGGAIGDHILPVQVSAPSGVRVAQVNPEKVHLSIDLLAEKKIPVTVSLKGTLAPGYVAMAPECRPKILSASGPEKVLSTIKQVTAVVDITSATKDVDETVKVSTGVAGVTLNPAVVQVVVPIASTALSKTVPVKLQVSGAPVAGCTLIRSYSEPGSVQIFGPAEVLDKIFELRTELVDINLIDKNLVKDVGLVPVAGVVGYQPGQVKVYLEVNKNEKQTEETPNGSELIPPKS